MGIEFEVDPDMLVSVEDALQMQIIQGTYGVVKTRMKRDRDAGKAVPEPQGRERSTNTHLYRAGDLQKWGSNWGEYIPKPRRDRSLRSVPRAVSRDEKIAQNYPQTWGKFAEIVDFLSYMDVFGVHLTRLDTDTNSPRTVRAEEILTMLMHWRGLRPRTTAGLFGEDPTVGQVPAATGDESALEQLLRKIRKEGE